MLGEDKVGTRGEYNQDFDLDKIHEAQGDIVTFVAPDAQQYMLTVRSGSKTVIDGKVIEVLPLIAQFRDFAFRTSKKEMIDGLRASRAYKAGRVKELSSLRKNREVQRAKNKAEELAADPELLKAAIAILKQGRSSTPEVASVR